MGITYLRRDQVQLASAGALVGGNLASIPGAGLGVFHGMKSAEAGDEIALNYGGTYRLAKASATVFAAGAIVFYDPTTALAVVGTIAQVEAGALPVGTAVLGVGSGDLAVEVIHKSFGPGAVWANVLAQPTVTASSTETVMGEVLIPAGALAPGFALRLDAAWTATATNSTDTSTFAFRLDSISGTVLWTSGAVDLADTNTAQVSSLVTVLTTGATGSLNAINDGRIHTTNIDSVTSVASHAMNVDLTIVCTYKNSTTNAGNTTTLNLFRAVAV